MFQKEPRIKVRWDFCVTIKLPSFYQPKYDFFQTIWNFSFSLEPFFQPSGRNITSSSLLNLLFELTKKSNIHKSPIILCRFSEFTQKLINHISSILQYWIIEPAENHPSVPTLWAHTAGDNNNLVIWNERWAINLEKEEKCENVKYEYEMERNLPMSSSNLRLFILGWLYS